MPVATVTNVTCYNAGNGLIQISGSGGTPPFTYAFGSGAFAYTSYFGSLGPNVYIVHLKDGNGCLKDTTITITQPAAIVPAVTKTNELCHGGNTGAINVLAVSGGTPPFVFALGAGAYHHLYNFSNLTAGTYTVHTMDNNSCVNDTTVVIAEPTAIVPTATVTNVLCNGGNSGQVVLSASGGNPGYRYATGPGSFGASGNFSSLTAGTFTFHILDANNCNHDTTITVTQPTKLTATFSSTPVSCWGGTNGSVTETAAGGIAPYSYQWSSTTATTASVPNLASGVYVGVVKDANGCQVTGRDTIISPTAINVTGTATNPICAGKCNGAISVGAAGGIAPYSFHWNTGVTLSNIGALCAGTYTVTITDAHSCTYTKSYTLTDPPPIVLNLGPDVKLCKGQTAKLNAGIKDRSAVFTWGSSNGFIGTDSLASLSAAGTYWVNVTSAKGCTAKDTLVINVSTQVIHAEFIVTTQAFQDSAVEFVNISNPAPDSIRWLVPSVSNVITDSLSSRMVSLRFKDTGVYLIGLTAMTNGCQDVFHDTVLVVKSTPSKDTIAASPDLIKSFTISPNPTNDGKFTVHVELSKTADVRFRMLSLVSYNVVLDKSEKGQTTYNVQYSIARNPGIYLLLLETLDENRVLKLIVQ